MFTPQQFKIFIDGMDNLQSEDLENVFTYFPFANMLNISILDVESIRLHINFIKKLVVLDTFYQHIEVVKCCWEFVLINILSIENVSAQDILFNLLEIMKMLVSNELCKVRANASSASYLRENNERVFNVLTQTAKSKVFAITHASIFNDIIKELIEIHGASLTHFIKNLKEIALVYKQLNAVQEMATIFDISLDTFAQSTELFDVCISWLLSYGYDLLTELSDENNLLSLLKLITKLFNKLNGNQSDPHVQAFQEFSCKLKNVSSHILTLSSTPVLRDESIKLFSILLVDYYFEFAGVKEDPFTTLSKLLQLPSDVKQWPYVKSDIFFYVCSFLCTYSSSLWDPSEIINSISSLIYSYDRFAITVPLLKCLCHVYPIVTTNISKVLLLGDELLIILSKFPYSLPKIITYHVAQLVWVLKRACAYVKKAVLSEWLKRDKDLDVVKKAILICRAGEVLLDILVDCTVDELVHTKTMEICHGVEYKELSESIAWMIPAALSNQVVLSRLILSNPGVPSDTQWALKLCEFMSLLLCSIHDTNVLRAACAYSKSLVTVLKAESQTVPLFCRNMKNVQYLAIKVKYVDDETAVEILRLLKVLVLVQKRNHTVLENPVEADLTVALTGSAVKTDKCLDLLVIIVTSKQVFLTLENYNIRNLFLNLFKMSREPSLAVRSFCCLTAILKTNNWLAYINNTSLFIEIQCSVSTDQEYGPEFLHFLTTWMKILRNFPCDKKMYLPDKRIISNYIKRSSYISQTQVTHLLQLLNKIDLAPEDLFQKHCVEFYRSLGRVE